MSVAGAPAQSAAPAAWTDLAGLHSITALGRADRGAGLQAAARQFESFFVTQLLKGMRSANEIFAADNPMNTNEMQFRQDMLDQQLGVSLAQGRGLGLAEVLGRQLRQQFGAPETAVAGAGTSVEAQLEARRIDAAPRESAPALLPRVARAALPPVVSSALRILEPVAQHAREKIAAGLFSGKEAFVRAVLPEARRAARALGIDHRVLIAQSALETGWGQSILSDHAGHSSHNLFNIKAGSYWEGRSVGVTTLEFSNGIPQQQRARFRAYGSFAESFADYIALLKGQPRYAAALANADDPARFMRSLQQAGYATDPAYAHKVMQLLADDAIAGAG